MKDWGTIKVGQQSERGMRYLNTKTGSVRCVSFSELLSGHGVNEVRDAVFPSNLNIPCNQPDSGWKFFLQQQPERTTDPWMDY